MVYTKVVKIRRKPALSPDKLRFLPTVNYWKKAKKMDGKKSSKRKKEEEIVLIMPCMFFFVKHRTYLGNTYP